MAPRRPAATTPSPAAGTHPPRLEPNSFAILFSQHYQRLWLVALAVTGDRNQADDLVQDAALTALDKLDQFEPGTNFLAWMARVVRLKALNAARTRVKRRTAATDPVRLDRTQIAAVAGSEHLSLPGDASGSDSLDRLAVHFDDDLLHALRDLSEVARGCLLLRVVADLSYAEIAAALDMPEGTAMSHVHRAKRVLRRRLQGKYHVVSSASETTS